MKRGKLFGYFLILIGLILIGFNVSITGAVIGGNLGKAISFVVGLVFVIGGTAFIFLERQQYLEHKSQIEEIVEAYRKRQINDREAAVRINKIVPVLNVRYKTGKEHAIVTGEGSYSIKINRGKDAEELLLSEYILAVRNNPSGIRNNEAHLDKGISTKHYLQGFLERLKKYKASHQKELDELLVSA